jgi:hypothetical protein
MVWAWLCGGFLCPWPYHQAFRNDLYGKQNGRSFFLIMVPTGCLSGSTIVQNMRLELLVALHNFKKI